jgi:hypothetical protein
MVGVTVRRERRWTSAGGKTGNRLMSVKEVRATLVALYETDSAGEAYRLGRPHAGRGDILCLLCCT